MLYWSTIFVISSVFSIFWFVQVGVEIILHDDLSRFRYSTGNGFFLAESKFVHDLNFDFFLFEHLPPFLIVDFCFRTLDFNSSFVCNV